MALVDTISREKKVAAQDALGSRRRCQAPREIVAQAGSLKSVVTWQDPADPRGIQEWIVYLDSEKSPYARVERNAKRIEIPLTGGASSRFAAVSAIGELPESESPRVPFVVTSNTDKLVVNGTAGQTSGTSPQAPPDWPSGPGGGGGSYGDHFRLAQ